MLGRPFDNAKAHVLKRISNPFYPILERFLPYGRRLRADFQLVHDYSRAFVREAVERIRFEDVGEKHFEEGEVGLFIRRLLQTEMSEDEIADSCLNLLLAGMLTVVLRIVLMTFGHPCRTRYHSARHHLDALSPPS